MEQKLYLSGSSSVHSFMHAVYPVCGSETAHVPVLLVNIPVKGIRLLDAAMLGKRRRVPFVAVWSQPGVVCSEKVTFDPLTFSKKNPSRAIPRSTYIHPPSLAKIRQRTSEE